MHNCFRNGTEQKSFSNYWLAEAGTLPQRQHFRNLTSHFFILTDCDEEKQKKRHPIVFAFKVELLLAAEQEGKIQRVLVVTHMLSLHPIQPRQSVPVCPPSCYSFQAMY